MTVTTRCAGLVAILALSALVLPAGVVLGLVAVVLVATVIDGLSVREAPPVRRELAEVLSRGAPTPLAVSAGGRDARRMLLRQPATPALEIRPGAPAADGRELRGEVLALRRGRHTLPGVASASLGPLGLARRRHPSTAPAEVQVYPDLLTARRLVLRLRQGRAAPDGRLRRGPLGLGTDFESIREYSPDDDIRQVNWRASARLGRPMSNQYRVEQDRDVLLLVDTGRLMAAPIGGGTLLDCALDAAVAVALAVDELGDRCGAIAFDGSIRRALDPRRLGGRRTIEALFDLEARLEDSDYERAFLHVGHSRRALILIFTDLVEETAARPLALAAPMLTRRHAVSVASAIDPDLQRLARGLAREGGEGPDIPPTPAAAGTRDTPTLYRALAARSVLEARAGAVAQIAGAGAEVVEAPPGLLPERCVQAYLRAKARARV
ncbi:MAG TPA: DUF58 domain-containing protein [Solirubrobacteraceae bacterium]|nr:DUF58 domain-containing protein [Solirubrobacteraceae bacterium]